MGGEGDLTIGSVENEEQVVIGSMRDDFQLGSVYEYIVRQAKASTVVHCAWCDAQPCNRSSWFVWQTGEVTGVLSVEEKLTVQRG